MTSSILDLAAEDALELEAHRLRLVSEKPEQSYLWFWSSPRALIVPRKLAVKPHFPNARRQMMQEGWPVAIRSTGGDVTPMGPGIVCVSIVYARGPGGPVEIATEYDKLCAPMERVLGPEASRGWMPRAFCDGEYNVQWQGRKFAGTAMRFRPCRSDKTRYAILSHALMLMRPPKADVIDALNRFLDLMSEGRDLDIDAHTGLPENRTEAAFLTDLEDAYHAQYGL